MIAIQGAVSARADSANDTPRLIAHRQFRLMPVILPSQPDWNKRVERWAGIRG